MGTTSYISEKEYREMSFEGPAPDLVDGELVARWTPEFPDAKTLFSEEEYRAMSFDGPTPDFVDGELVERSVPYTPHSAAQTDFAVYFSGRSHDSVPLLPLVELDIRVAPKRTRVADVAIFAHKRPSEAPITVPPLAVIEILSPGEKYKTVLAKLNDYRHMGVPNIWVVNLDPPQFQVYSAAGLLNVDAFELPEYGVHIDPAILT